VDTSFDIDSWLGRRRDEVNQLLDIQTKPEAGDADPGRLVEAVRYSLLAPGKRLRPLLGLAAAEAVGAELTPAVRKATAAVELIHCYSLIHDDLPAMDNDDMRRGKPTSHKAFGEASAILAGDGLCTLAFQWIATAGLEAPPARASAYLQAGQILADAAGLVGMVRGQGRDLGEPAPKTLEEAELLHSEKTGALFRASVEVGAVVGGASEAQRHALVAYAEAYGIAFQHADDIDDNEHAHLAEQARTRLRALTGQAIESVSGELFGARAAPLHALAQALAAKANL